MTRHPDDPDFDVVDDIFLAPARDSMVEGYGFHEGYFKDFPSPTAMSQLAEAGILVRGWDMMRLGTAIQTFHSFPSLHYGKESIDREQRIAEISSELIELLSHGEGEQDGWRYFWGNADGSDFEETLEQPEPEGTIDVPDLRENLDILAKSAHERLDWLHSAKEADIEPRSNRPDRTRYFYWLMLIAFWRYQLQRDVKTCTAPDRDAYGPLIKLIQVMSAKGMSDEETKGDTIRAFIRRNADRAAFFQSYFQPHPKATSQF